MKQGFFFWKGNIIAVSIILTSSSHKSSHDSKVNWIYIVLTVGGEGAVERRQLQDSDGRREAECEGGSGQPVREDSLRLQCGLESVWDQPRTEPWWVSAWHYLYCAVVYATQCCGYIFIALGSYVTMSHGHINKAVCHQCMDMDEMFPYSFRSVWRQAEECLWPIIRPSIITIVSNMSSIKKVSLCALQGNI